MPSNRKFIFANDEICHVCNRGVEKRTTFTDKRELNRVLLTLDDYRHSKPQIKLSRYLIIPQILREQLLENLKRDCSKLVDIICFCFMPNHFHFLLKQKMEKGISVFISNFTNSYTRYFNTKHKRIGSLFEGVFKAVRVASEEQLLHISRYIHLNPVSSFLIEPENLENYKGSSYLDYLGLSSKDYVAKDLILSFFPSPKDYKKFVLDQVDYARELKSIKHLSLE